MEQPTPAYLQASAPPLPMVPRELIRIAKHRHDQGQMSPQVLQILTSVSLIHLKSWIHWSAEIQMFSNLREKESFVFYILGSKCAFSFNVISWKCRALVYPVCANKFCTRSQRLNLHVYPWMILFAHLSIKRSNLRKKFTVQRLFLKFVMVTHNQGWERESWLSQ